MQEALEHLDPASRALLDLSLRRGMRAEDIADVLGADADSVVRMCDGALARIAAGIGMSGGDEVARTRSLVAELPADAWPPAALAGNGASIGANGAAVNGGNGAGAATVVGGLESGGAAIDSANAGKSAAAADSQAGSGTVETTDEVSPAVEATSVGEAEAEALAEAEAPAAKAESEVVEIEPEAAETAASEAEPGPDVEETDTEVVGEPATAAEEEPGAEEIDPLDAAVAFEAIPEIDVPREAAAEDGEPASEAAAGAPARRRRSLIVAMLLAVVIVAGMVVALTTTGHHKHQVAAPPAPVRHRATAPPPPGGAKQTLTPVGGAPAGAHATAQLADGRRQLMLHVAGLRPPSGGTYEVWLFNSVIDSTPIGRFDAVPADLTAGLPVDFRRFRFVDVSLQPRGQTAVHSGESVLRARVGRLR